MPQRGKAKPAAPRALLHMMQVYFRHCGFHVSSVKEEGDIVIVRFPHGGPHGLKQGKYGRSSIQQIEEFFLMNPTVAPGAK